MDDDAVHPARADGAAAGRGELSGEQLLDELARVTARLAQLQAEQVRVLSQLQARPPVAALPGCPDKQWLREQVACVLSCSPEFAGHRLAEAEIACRSPAFLQLLADGQVGMGHVRALGDTLLTLDDDTGQRVVNQVVPRAGGQSVSRFRAALRRSALIAAPRAEEEVRAANVADRRVRIAPYAPGVSSLWALLPEAEAAAIATAITALATSSDLHAPSTGSVAGSVQVADQRATDQRTAHQRRADALVQLVLGGHGSTVIDTGNPAGVSARGLRPLVQVSVALSTLLGLDEQPADLDGVGPIPAALARRLAGDPTGTWRRIVTDPTGQLIDYGRTVYEPPMRLAEHVRARDRTCRFPYCNRRAVTSEVDHRIAWTDGGHTNADNLHVLCSRHHHLKHETRWRVHTPDADGTGWTSPTGQQYTAPPADPYPLDGTTRNAYD